MKNIAKPKLVFFQFKYDTNLSKFILLHRQQHSKCLSKFFDVTVINEDCDYQEICDRYQPDIALFESGVNYRRCYRLKIKNTHTHPEIPKIGLHNGDSWCEARAGFLSDMEHWGIETFFSICTTTAEHTPEIAENLFVWANFIDADIYRDYGQPKIVPVMFTGYINPLYPWRQKINKIISEHYPSLICPHLGYEQPVSRMLYGEQYARVINASWFVPACGTLAKEIVRKHFEIPASKSCLITEKSPALEAAGFIDMQNCIFVDEHDVLDKLDYLFQHQEELEKITNAGYQLVHSRHTLKQRDQILQWFNLYQDLKPTQRIVQTNPFEPLTIVERSLEIKNSHIICNGLDIALLHQGDKKLRAGKYEEAEVLYLQCHNHIPWMPEPKLRLTLCNLYKGNAKIALDWIVQPVKYTLENYKAFDPDPVEWAYGIISLLCLGKLDAAVNNANQFPSLSHPELNRTRWVINLLKAEENIAPLIENESLKHRYSIHQLPSLSFNEWIENLCIILNSCQQFTLAELLKNYLTLETSSFNKKENDNDRTKEVLGRQAAAIRLNWFTKLPVVSEIVYILNPSPFKTSLIVRLRTRLKLKTRILEFLQK
ncbi:MAG: glycosyltransferase family 1 protein [Dolichospermum sp. BR01]|nr:glycosyltransferase family 1 protein [Dolichospermum sp. BR01]